MTTEPAVNPQWTVRRSGRASRIGSTSLMVLGLALFAVPQVFAANIVQQLTSLLIFLILYLTYRDLSDAGLMMLAVPEALAGGVFFQFLFPKILHGWSARSSVSRPG